MLYKSLSNTIPVSIPKRDDIKWAFIKVWGMLQKWFTIAYCMSEEKDELCSCEQISLQIFVSLDSYN